MTPLRSLIREALIAWYRWARHDLQHKDPHHPDLLHIVHRLRDLKAERQQHQQSVPAMVNCTNTGGCTGNCRHGRDCKGSHERTRGALGLSSTPTEDEVVELTVTFIVGLISAGIVWGLVDVANDILQRGWTP